MKDDETPEEVLKYNRRIKKAILDVMFKEVETFYVHCMPNPLLMVGKRGLVDKETTEGIILVLGPYSTRNLAWDDNFIFCEMQFGSWEKVDIPYECISRIFDKTGQVIMQWATMTAPDRKGDSPIRALNPGESVPVGNESSAGLETGDEQRAEDWPNQGQNKDKGSDSEKNASQKTKQSDPLARGKEKSGGKNDAASGDAKSSRVIQVDFTKKNKKGDD